MAEKSSIQLKERYKFERAMSYSLDIGIKLIDFSDLNIEFGYSEYEFLKLDNYLSECYDSYMKEVHSNFEAMSNSDVVDLKQHAKILILSTEKNIVDVDELASVYYKYNIDGIFHIDLEVTVRFFEQYFQDQLYYLKTYLAAIESLVELKEAKSSLNIVQDSSNNLKVLPMNKNSVVMYGWFMCKIDRWKFRNQTDLATHLLGNFQYINGSDYKMEVIGADVTFSKLKKTFSKDPKNYSHFLNEFKVYVTDLTTKENELLDQLKFPLPKTDVYYNDIDW